jgi:hypothetical protein
MCTIYTVLRLGYGGDTLHDQPLHALTTDEKLTGIIDSILELNKDEFKILSAEIEPHERGEEPSNQIKTIAESLLNRSKGRRQYYSQGKVFHI